MIEEGLEKKKRSWGWCLGVGVELDMMDEMNLLGRAGCQRCENKEVRQ